MKVVKSLVVAALLFAGIAHAAPCQEGQLDTLIGTSCEVGSLSFTFGSFFSDSRIGGVSTPTTARDIYFRPTSDGFSWQGDFNLSSVAGEMDNVLRFGVTLGVRTLLPDVAVVGTSTFLDGVSATPSIGFGGYAFVQATSANWPSPTPAPVHAESTIGYDYSNYLTRETPGVVDPFWVDDYGFVSVFALAQNGGRVSFDSVTFGFATEAGRTPVVAVPEPSTYALMLAGLAAVAFAAKRRRVKDAQLTA